MRSQKLINTSDAQKQWRDLNMDINVMTLNILNLEFFYISWIHYKIEGIITKFVEKHQSNVFFNRILSRFQTIACSILPSFTPLAPSSKYVNFSWTTICRHKLPMCFFKCMNFFFTYSKLVYTFESLALKPMQGSRVVHLTVLAPLVDKNLLYFYVCVYSDEL